MSYFRENQPLTSRCFFLNTQTLLTDQQPLQLPECNSDVLRICPTSLDSRQKTAQFKKAYFHGKLPIFPINRINISVMIDFHSKKYTSVTVSDHCPPMQSVFRPALDSCISTINCIHILTVVNKNSAWPREFICRTSFSSCSSYNNTVRFRRHVRSPLKNTVIRPF